MRHAIQPSGPFLAGLLLSLFATHTATQGGSLASQPEAGSFECLDSTHVTVEVLAKPLPSGKSELDSLLWEDFINGPTSERFVCRVHGWRARAESFARSLIAKARADSLDAESLAACLAKVLADTEDRAYLPISASYAKYERKAVWVILVNWEMAGASLREVLGHSRVYVLEAQDCRLVRFVTCS